MIISSLRRSGLLRAVSAVGVVAVVSACGGGAGDAASSSASSSSGSSSSSAPPSQGYEPASVEELSAALLPAEAFGPGASVTPVTQGQLEQGSLAAGGSLEDTEITPEACAAAVQGTQPRLDEFEDVAAQVAVTGTATTVEVLAVGGPAAFDPGQISEQVAACPEAQVTSPEVGTATIRFAEVEVPDLGDGSAAISFTTVGTGPDGQEVTVPALTGVVQDGERTLTLLSIDPQGAPLDPAAFADLLEQAFQAQAEALD